MNIITVTGYIANPTEKINEANRVIMFNILDNYKTETEQKFNAFRCVYITKSEYLFGWILKKKNAKQQFTVIGELREETYKDKKYLTIFIKNLA